MWADKHDYEDAMRRYEAWQAAKRNFREMSDLGNWTPPSEEEMKRIRAEERRQRIADAKDRRETRKLNLIFSSVLFIILLSVTDKGIEFWSKIFNIF